MRRPRAAVIDEGNPAVGVGDRERPHGLDTDVGHAALVSEDQPARRIAVQA